MNNLQRQLKILPRTTCRFLLQPESMVFQKLLLVTELMGGTLLRMVDQQNLLKMRNKA